jgi:hypothetical protein
MVVFLPSVYGYIKPVLHRDNGAGVVLTVGTPGVVGLIQIQNPFPVRSTISVWLEVEIATSPVGLFTGSHILEGHKQIILLRTPPVSLEVLFVSGYFELKLAPAKEVLYVAFGVGHSHYLLFSMLTKLKLESVALVGGIIFQTSEPRLILGWDW